MRLNTWVRQSHRWLSLAFMAGFVVNAVAAAMAGGEQPAPWVYLLVLIPLFLLMPTGLYMFVLPYASRRRGDRARVAAGEPTS